MVAPRRRRNQNRFLDNLGRVSPGTLVMFGIAILLLCASAGIVGTTVARRSSATTADQAPTAEPTPFVAIVETPYPTPITPTASATATARGSASPATPTTAGNRTPTATASAAVVGSGQSKAARGLAASMAITLGGTLPPAQAAAAPQPTSGAFIPPAIPTPTPGAPPPTPTPIRTGNTGGGNTGGGNTGGGSTLPTPTRTPTPIPPPPTAPPTATATATATVVPLPAVAFPGPGSNAHSYSLNYVVATDFAATPEGDPTAYIIQWESFTRERAEAIARAWGINAPAEATGDGFKVSDGKGSVIVNSTTGLVIYSGPAAAAARVAALASPTVEATGTTPATGTARPGPALAASPTVSPSAAPSASATTVPPARATPTVGPALTDAQALEQARAWLTQAGLLPADASAGAVARPTADQIVVTFRPKLPENRILGDPAITVKFGTSGPVREVYYRWAKNPNPRLATLRGAAVAWGDVQAGKGYLEVEQTVPANLPAGTVYRGTATVTKVSIGLRNAASGNGTNYLIPIYIFEGTVALDNPAPGQTGPFAFRLYVQATP